MPVLPQLSATPWFSRLRPGLLLLALVALAQCHSQPAEEDDAEAEVAARAAVTVASVQTDTVSDVLHLNAVSAYPAKDVLRATTTGYVLAPVPVVGQQMRAGQTAFTLQTKESRVLHLDKLTGDPRLRFSGVVRIAATRTGVLSSVDKQAGEYVQDGEQLGVLFDQSRFGFVLDVPATQLRYVRTGQSCRITLPDGRVLPGRVAELLPSTDLAAQTQRYTVRVVGAAPTLPENLAVTIDLDKTAPYQAQVLPREAVLSDETQTEFWVMRLLNDSTAVRVPVEPGQEHGKTIEIKSPRLNPQDRIIITGNYGLEDTAAVRLVRHAE